MNDGKLHFSGRMDIIASINARIWPRLPSMNYHKMSPEEQEDWRQRMAALRFALAEKLAP